MTDCLSVAMAQLNFLVGDIKGNANRIISAAERARDEMDCHLIVFPELALTGYPPEDLLLRPAFIADAAAELDRIREHVRDIALIVGHPQCSEGKLYNAASFLSDGRVRAVYHKQHLPNYSVFDEKRYFHPGSDPCVVDFQDVRVGITICEDVWQSGPVLQAKGAGAEIVININASPYHMDRARERHDVVAARAIEAGLPIVYVNLVGGQDELVFDGASFVVDAEGLYTQRSVHFAESLERVDLDRAATVAPVPAAIVGDDPLEKNVYDALVLGVRDYVDKNRFPGVVIGLSGGIDSALTLAVAVDALGADRVEAVLMPSRFTAQMSIDDAVAEADALGVKHHLLSIEPMFSAFLSQLQPLFGERPMDETEENIQARCRGMLLMAISNKFGKMVLTTGNKSEMAVGYSTLYGDMAGGFAVIKDVPKTLVYRLARYRNGLSAVIPERVLSRPPSAELAQDQKDEDSLPPYEVLDVILEGYVEGDLAPKEIVAQGFDAEVVARVVRLVDRNEYKRRQSAPGVRITRRAFGRDRRYPITSGFRPHGLG